MSFNTRSNVNGSSASDHRSFFAWKALYFPIDSSGPLLFLLLVSYTNSKCYYFVLDNIKCFLIWVSNKLYVCALMIKFSILRLVWIMDSSISRTMAFPRSWWKECSRRARTCSLFHLMRRWWWFDVVLEVTHHYTTRKVLLITIAHEIDWSFQWACKWFQFLEIGDPKELFTFGSSEGVLGQHYPNKWPSEGWKKKLSV